MAPPPMKPPGGPPPTTNIISKGDNSMAYRTRSRNPPPKNNSNQMRMTGASIPSRSATVAVPPGAGGNNAMSATTTNTKTATAKTMDPSSLHVDDAIAKRRAELRRLQQNRGGGVAGLGGLATARSRLGHMQPPLFGAGGGGGGVVAATAALLNSTPVPVATPGVGIGKKTPTPSTATIARRLDASYGPPIKSNTAGAGHTPFGKRQPLPQAKPAATKPSLGNFKRTSEIFDVGKQQTSKNNVATNAAPKPVSAQPTATSTNSLPSPTLSPMNHFGNKNLMKSSPKSPFGGARATASPMVLNPEKTVPVLPMMVPPLALEPPSGVNNNSNATGASTKQSVAPKQSMESQPRSLMSMAVNQQTKSNVSNNAPSTKAPPVNQQPSASPKPVEEIESGKTTPIMSNVHDNPEAGAKAEVGEGSSKKSAVKNSEVSAPTKGQTTPVRAGTQKVYTPNTSNMSRLVNDLQRTEQEKKEALEQVSKLKALLEQGKQQQKERANKSLQRPQPLAVNQNSSLRDQFEGMVSTKGESVAVAWISKQLEGMTNDREGYSSLSPRYRNAEETNLLSSIIPPLTPRSRPGSRAASPERGGGGGLLMSQSLGQSTGNSGSARGKRMTTPLPKHLNRHDNQDGNEREGFVGSTAESVEHEYLVAAAKSIPNEYGTQLASYLVRRPYIDLKERDAAGDAAGDNSKTWESMKTYSHLTSKQNYLNCAAAMDPSSLEVLVYIEADGSVFTLTGTCNVRHGKLPEGENETKSEESLDWDVFDDVEKMDRALGRVTYIDVEGNEREYWLDSIYEEALTTRESYCMSMISAACALKEVTGGMGVAANAGPLKRMSPIQLVSPMVQPSQQPSDPLQPAGFMQQPPMNIGASDHLHQPPMQTSYAPSAHFMPPPAGSIPPNQMQNGTTDFTPSMPLNQPELSKSDKATALPSDLSQPTPTRPSSEQKSNLASPKEKQSQPSTNSDQKPPTTSTTKPPPDEEYESADSALPLMVISLFSLLFSMISFVIKIPFRIGSMLFTFWVLVIAMRILWLFLADDNGAWEMGAGVEYEYNMPGIY